MTIVFFVMTRARIEQALERALEVPPGELVPPRLEAALRYSVFPGGGRVRPLLTLAVASACGDPSPRQSDAAAVALELVHSASLAHDDMPCFDDALIRRGKPAVHRVFGEELTLLVGDGLIVRAFEVVAEAGLERPQVGARLATELARASGAVHGIVAGQAWESEEEIDWQRYHEAKTASLFEAAAAMGAIAAGAEPRPWRLVGKLLGKAYQIADDLSDATGTSVETGKSAGRDAALSRPSAVTELGIAGACARVQELLADAERSIPLCHDRSSIVALVRAVGERLIPKELKGPPSTRDWGAGQDASVLATA